MEYQLINLLESNHSKPLLSNFKNTVETFCKKDKLYENYINLSLDDFICLTGVIENNDLIALSGIQSFKNRWGENLVRVSSRAWVHPKYRISSLSKLRPNLKYYFNSQMMIPYQLKFLENTEFSFAMITREGNYRRSFTKNIELVNSHNKTSFKVLDGVYNVCNHMDIVPEGCKQMIAIYNLKQHDFNHELCRLQSEFKLLRIC